MKNRDFIALLQEQDPELEIKVLFTGDVFVDDADIETGETEGTFKTFHVHKGQIVLGWHPGVERDPADYVAPWEKEKPSLEPWRLKGLAAPYIESSNILTKRLKARAEYQGQWPQEVLDWVESELEMLNADGYESEEERQKMMEYLRGGVVERIAKL